MQPASLHEDPPTLKQRVRGAIAPCYMIWFVLSHGLVPAIKHQLSNISWRLFSPSAWWTLILSYGFPWLMRWSDEECDAAKKRLMSEASGVVLEIGAGSGENLVWYQKEKVSNCIGVEPFAGFYPDLQAAILRSKLQDVYTIAPCSISDQATLKQHGIGESTLDTIVCIQCLCSCPEPEKLIVDLHRWLKPGGKLLIYEHVLSDDPITRFFQMVWTKCGWRRLFLDCEMTRPLDVWLSKLEWKEFEVERIRAEQGHLFPHAVGVFVKAE